jgi:nicotinamidase-related amidase
MQNDFCLPGAILHVKCAGDCLPYCQVAVQAARAHKVPVLWVIRQHDRQGMTSKVYSHASAFDQFEIMSC